MNELFKRELKLFFPRLRQISRESDRSYLSIIKQYLTLRLKNGLEFNEYYMYEFDKASRNFIDEYLCTNEKLQYLKLLNLQKYYTLGRNKFLTNILLERLNIPTTEQLFYYDPSAGISTGRLICSHNDAKAFILENSISSFIYKETESSQGDGVGKIVDVQNDGAEMILIAPSQKRLKVGEVFSRKPLVVEKIIHQTKQMNDINPDSVNTLRVMTALFPNREVKVVATFFKIGRKGSFVDNAGKGGNVNLPVDPKTGIGYGAIQFDGFRKVTPITHHPDSKVLLTDFRLNNWDAIMEEVKGFQARIPFLKAIGWDIAITDKGPVAIEVNDLWDNTGQYFIQRGWKNEFVDCYEKWKNDVK